MRLVALFHAGTGVLLNMGGGADCGRMTCHAVGQLHGDLQTGDILVGDRAFCSFAAPGDAGRQGIWACFERTRNRSSVFGRTVANAAKHSRKRRHRSERGLPTSRWMKRLGRHDQLVEYVKPKSRPAWMSESAFAALPDAIKYASCAIPSPGVVVAPAHHLIHLGDNVARLPALFGIRIGRAVRSALANRNQSCVI